MQASRRRSRTLARLTTTPSMCAAVRCILTSITAGTPSAGRMFHDSSGLMNRIGVRVAS